MTRDIDAVVSVETEKPTPEPTGAADVARQLMDRMCDDHDPADDWDEYALPLLAQALVSYADAHAKDAVAAERERLSGHDRTWPLVDVLRRMRATVEHGLQVHGCDHHGHEGDKYAAEEAAHYIAMLATHEPAPTTDESEEPTPHMGHDICSTCPDCGQDECVFTGGGEYEITKLCPTCGLVFNGRPDATPPKTEKP